jgi:DNA-binding XRE family transcriptional regulator
MSNISVYLPLSLNSENARKIYCLSRLDGVSVNCIVEKIIDQYLEDREIPDILNKSNTEKPDNSGVREKIGKKIAYFRGINYLSQKRLGDLVNLDQRSISSIEVGKRRLDMIEAIAIAQVLGVEIKDILS